MESSTNQNVERSITAITDVLNGFAISEGPRTHVAAAELSSLFAGLFTNSSMIDKLITDLNNKHKRFALVRYLIDDARLQYEGMSKVFSTLSNGQQRDVLVCILIESSLPRFWRLLKIFADIQLGQCRHLPSKIGTAPALILQIHNLPDTVFDAVGETCLPEIFLSSMLQLQGLPIDLLEPIQKGINWVIDDGSPGSSTDLLYQIPTIQVWNILSVSLRFTMYDLRVQEKKVPYNGMIKNATNQGLEEAMARLSTDNDAVAQLASFWQAKYAQVASLRLHSLTLDLNEAFNPIDGTFMGIEVVRTLPRFLHGPPPELAVLAPTMAWRTEILSILS